MKAVGPNKMKTMYTLKRDTFFNWYFRNKSKEQIASFISPYFMSIVSKDVRFGLKDLLKDSRTVPSYLLEDYPTDAKPNVDIDYSNITLI